MQTVEKRTENQVLDTDRRPVFITERFGNWIPIFFGTQVNKCGDMGRYLLSCITLNWFRPTRTGGFKCKHQTTKNPWMSKKNKNNVTISIKSRSQWPWRLKSGSTTARLLGLLFRIALEAWMSVSCECRMLSGWGLCDQPNIRPVESYRVWRVLSVIGKSHRGGLGPLGLSSHGKEKKKKKITLLFCATSGSHGAAYWSALWNITPCSLIDRW